MAKNFITNKKIPRDSSGNKLLTFHLTGEWDRALRVFKNLGPAVKIASLYSQKKIADDVKKRVIGHLVNQDLGWKGLSQKYLTQKAKTAADTRILLAYNQYYHSIEVWEKKMEQTVYVGVKKGKYTYSVWDNTRSRIDIARIAAIHEFSKGRRIPKRPLWNPTIAEMGGERGIKQKFVKHLVGKLRVMGIPVKQFQTLWR